MLFCTIGGNTATTAFIALLSLGLFYGFPNKTLHAAAFTILAKTYSNSVLAVFNNRIRIVGGRESLLEEEHQLHISLSPRTATGPTSSSHSQFVKRNSSEADVRADGYVHTDSANLNEQVTFSLP